MPSAPGTLPGRVRLQKPHRRDCSPAASARNAQQAAVERLQRALRIVLSCDHAVDADPERCGHAVIAPAGDERRPRHSVAKDRCELRDERIGREQLGIPVVTVGVGPARDEIIWTEAAEPLRASIA